MRGLDQDRIVEAALELLDRDGLVGVTTRRLAERLGVRSPSLYWHIRDREQLLGLLSDRIVADARWPEPSSGWRGTAEGLMREYLRCLLAHRDAARVVAGRPPMGPNRLRGAEMLLRALLSAGLGDREAIDAGLVLTTYVVGFALEQQAAELSAAGNMPTDPDRYPTLARLSKAVPAAGWARFEEGLRLILDGVQSRLPGEQARRSVTQSP
ncbi:MAG TPA: TetR/AcrR family transcriptional regulator [Candidatus Dormibacteraeota bacterium]|nr:TetR/AcrR family transcriptional regulator [Candidatus Dormibacteraeota bacterium]